MHTNRISFKKTSKSFLNFRFRFEFSIEKNLKIEGSSSILIDELTLNKASNLINIYNTLKNLIVSMSRTLPFNVNSPLQGLLCPLSFLQLKDT